MATGSKQTTSEGSSRTMTHPARQLWFAGLGTIVTAVTGAQLVFRAMAEEGEKFARRERPDVERAMVVASDRVKDMGEQIEVAVEESMSAGLRRFGVPSRQEIRSMAVRIEQLSAKIEAMGLDPRFLQGVDEALQQEPN